MSNFKFQMSNVMLAHDSFTQLGGAEKVVEVVHEMFPEAPVQVLVMDRKLKEKFAGWKVRTTWLQRLYDIYPHFQHLFLFTPFAAESVTIGKGGSSTFAETTADKRPYPTSNLSILLSSSSSFAKGFRIQKPGIHICYCHTPTRFLWMDEGYVNQEVPFLLRPLVHLIIKWMRKWDYKAAQRVDYFIANSKETQKRIKEYYNRESVVIYPPVDTGFWGALGPVRRNLGAGGSSPPNIGGESSQTRRGGIKTQDSTTAPLDFARGTPPILGGEPQNSSYFLLAGRLQPYKKNDLIIEIFNELGLPLHVVGTGRQEKYLRSIAKSNISFYGRVSDEELRNQYAGARGFIYPQIEDAGLMPLEAAACGTASIGIAKGGSMETIIPGVTGELFSDYDWDEIKRTIMSWNPEKYSISTLRQHAEQFSKERFKEQIIKKISELEK